MAEAKKAEEVTHPERYVMTEIAIQKDIAIMDTKTEDVFTEKGLLLEIMNKLDRIEKALIS